MSCLSELQWAVYADGELEASLARGADAHLIHCEDCRGRVLAVREESLLLASAFQDRGPATVRRPAAAGADTDRTPLYARPAGLLALAVAMGVIGTLVEARLAAGASLASFDPRTLVTRALGTVFVLRERAPGLFELALAVGATAGASGLATFGVSAVLRRWMGPALLLGVLLGGGLASPSEGLEHRFEDHVVIASGERVEGSLLVSGDRVEVDGVVVGDLIAAADEVVLRGRVEGNLFVFSEELAVDGRVTGSTLAFVERIRIAGRLEDGAYLGTERLDFAPGSVAARDLYLFASRAFLDGRVERDLYGFVGELELRGDVGRDVDVFADELALGEGARVAGRLEAALPDGVGIEGLAAGRVAGEVEVSPHPHSRGEGLERYATPRFWVKLAIRITAAFLFGMLLYALAPGLFRPEWPAAVRTLGLGLLVLVGAPVLLVLLGVTLVGLPVAVLGLFAWVTALYAAGVLVAGRLGAALLDPEPGSQRAFGLALLVGLLVLAVGASLPFFGPLVRAVAALGGLGILAQAARERFEGRAVA